MPEMGDDPARVELLRAIREREAALAAMYMPQGGRLLEIGAGMGYEVIGSQKLTISPRFAGKGRFALLNCKSKPQ
jgi:hypothetical protein